MGSNLNFRNFVDAPSGTNLLIRQPSVYSLTFDEFLNTWGGLGKDFGSMNMDELLKSIWSAEETQAMTSTGGGGGDGGGGSSGPGNLQKQGSITLPRTLSQKTVDEVWKGLFKENEGGGGGNDVSSLPQRQRTLGEMTLEEFLARVGVVREDVQTQQDSGRLSSGAVNGDLSRMSHNISYNNASLAMNNPRIQSPLPQPQPLFPKPATMAFASALNIPNTSQFVSSPVKGMMGITEPGNGNSVIQVSGVKNGGIGVAVPMGKGSPGASQLSPVVSKNTMNLSPVSPVPYAFSRVRKPNGALEKVVERRQRRMIKNRESAARSRARKQAYTLELEAEVAKLKELNEELQKKQNEFMEMQKNQILQTVNGNFGNKRLCLRRTLTGPW